MKYCPKCGADSYIVDSRVTSEGVKRRRACQTCGYRWNTIESTRIYCKKCKHSRKGDKTLYCVIWRNEPTEPDGWCWRGERSEDE